MFTNKNDKNIPVYFSETKKHPIINETVGILPDAKKLRKILENITIPQGACLGHIAFKFQDHFHFSQSDFYTTDNMTRIHKKSLEVTDFPIVGMKYLCAEQDWMKKAMDGKLNPSIKHCRDHFVNGKCQCPFMINTLGKLLLPKYYNNQKTK